VKAYEDKASRTSEWFVKFRDGRELLEDDEHSGRPSTSRTIEIVEEIHDPIKQDRCMSMRSSKISLVLVNHKCIEF